MSKDFGSCPICKKYDYMPFHSCGDCFFVWCEDWDRDDAQEIYEVDVEEAAKKFLKDNFSDFEYPSSVTCFVDDLEGKIHKFRVDAEMEPSFRAERLSVETYDREGNDE